MRACPAGYCTSNLNSGLTELNSSSTPAMQVPARQISERRTVDALPTVAALQLAALSRLAVMLLPTLGCSRLRCAMPPPGHSASQQAAPLAPQAGGAARPRQQVAFAGAACSCLQALLPAGAGRAGPEPAARAAGVPTAACLPDPAGWTVLLGSGHPLGQRRTCLPPLTPPEHRMSCRLPGGVLQTRSLQVPRQEGRPACVLGWPPPWLWQPNTAEDARQHCWHSRCCRCPAQRPRCPAAASLG